MTVTEAAEALAAGRTSSVELTRACLDRIAKRNPEINAFITVTDDEALARAEEMDREISRDRIRSRLHGIPFAHKDNIMTAGVRTTSGSKVFADLVPERDAKVARLLNEAGAVLIGKTNLHELAYGITSDNPHYGAVRNPHDRERIPGGSSGGSAAAVADGMCLLATGTDTGGSIRIPASYCGVVGMKPSYGLVSRAGVQPLGITLDHVGALAPCVRDAAIALECMSGQPMHMEEHPSLRGVIIGVPETFYFEDIDENVSRAVRRAVEVCAREGAEIQDVTIPDIGALNAVSRAILLAEAASIYSDPSLRREDFGDDVLALLDQGRLLPAVDYVNAQRLRKVFLNHFEGLLQIVDVLLTPATPITAPRIGQREVEPWGDVRLTTTRLVRGINAIGFPALSMPCGRYNGLPIGLQLIAGPNRDADLLNAAAALEDALS